MKNIIIIIGIGFVIIMQIFCFSQNASAEVENVKVGHGISVTKATLETRSVAEVIRKMQEIDEGLTDSTLEKFFPEQINHVNALKIILGDENHSLKRRLLAAKLLGELSSVDVTDVLVDNLVMGVKKAEEFRNLNENNFPAGFALIQIGIPSRVHLLNRIKIADDEEIIRLCVFVLMKIEDKDVARFILEREIGKETGASQREKLEKALSYLN
ncbi:MAG: hypothetical protein KJ893_10255 [Candidatus Omnitrophica bacterium]|nr:hypothetical protein [Candidatus Omnitrophota bacterium]MBU4478554.1 hypothetical protein [Candidatus Omnitrophota bacterium]MCG2703397.1 hypothetical protein [Candidatus Omnitrophota bacterium]